MMSERSHNNHLSKAYVRKLQEHVEIKLRYADQDIGLDQLFIFIRQLDENVQHIKERMAANLERACLKAHKKKLKSREKAKLLEPSVHFKLIVELKKNGDPVDDCTVQFWDLIRQDNVELIINERIYQFEIDPPTVQLLRIPSMVMAGFPIYISKLKLENCTVDQCEFEWFKSQTSLASAPKPDSELWRIVGKGVMYAVTNSDLGSWLQLKCTPKNGQGRVGLPENATTSQVVAGGPGPCPFEVRHNSIKEPMMNAGFRVLTYNILADMYADKDVSRKTLYPYCPFYALAIDYRKQLILKELIGYNADIICLQEVDKKVFDEDLTPVLSSRGYRGAFSKKGGQVTEGTACFYSTSKFRALSCDSFHLSSVLPDNPILADLYGVIRKNENLAATIIERTTSLQLLVLESVHSDKRVIVANTHLYSHPDADHIRLLQAAMSLRLAHDLHRQEVEKGKDVSFIFCGDFNSLPENGVLEMMTQHMIKEDYSVWSNNEKETVRGFSFYNPIIMGSACGTPSFTHFVADFNGCLDYIFYEKSKLAIDQVVPLPSLEEITKHVAIPSVVFPSDHIALIADLKWI